MLVNHQNALTTQQFYSSIFLCKKNLSIFVSFKSFMAVAFDIKLNSYWYIWPRVGQCRGLSLHPHHTYSKWLNGFKQLTLHGVHRAQLLKWSRALPEMTKMFGPVSVWQMKQSMHTHIHTLALVSDAVRRMHVYHSIFKQSHDISRKVICCFKKLKISFEGRFLFLASSVSFSSHPIRIFLADISETGPTMISAIWWRGNRSWNPIGSVVQRGRRFLKKKKLPVRTNGLRNVCAMQTAWCRKSNGRSRSCPSPLSFLQLLLLPIFWFRIHINRSMDVLRTAGMPSQGTTV